MKIGFFCTSEDYFPYAAILIESAKKMMPDVDVYHLTDGNCSAITGSITRRLAGDMPMGVRRMSLHCECDGDWLLTDCDVMFASDVREAFDDAFNIGVTDRIGTYMENTPYAKVMPYNNGVVFSRSTDFWKEALGYLKNAPATLQEWEGEQRILCEMVEKSKNYRFKVFPGKRYNFTPEYRDEDISHASILHYKGGRKAWMADAAARL